MKEILAAIARMGSWAYVLEAGLVFAEDALFFGFVLPGETILAFCAFLAQQHVLDVSVVLGVAVVAAILGDQTGYEIGKRLGPSLEKSKLGRRIGAGRWAAAQGLLVERGGFAVFLGRWLAFLRALIPTTSGLVGMRRRTFTLWNVLGGVTWAVAWTAVGFIAGASWESAARRFGEVTAAVALLVALAIYIVVSLSRRRRSARSA